MRTSASRLLILLLAVMALAACTRGGGGDGVSEEGPRNPAVPVQHLIDAPPYPAPVTDDPDLVELHSPEGDNRHHLYLAEFGAAGTLDGELVRGSVVLVAEGATLTVPDGASTAELDESTVATVADCPAPCEVAGPALVAPLGWLSGIGVSPGWKLVVPAPAD